MHQVTGDEEDVGAFWIRHTFRRPRDIAFIGRDLAAIDPRRTPEAVRQQITRSAAVIAQGFITEMSPHLPQFDRELVFRLIRRNVIPQAELEALDDEYDRLFAARQGGGEPVACHVFASMFKIGLLGYVGMHPETAELVQCFRHPGEVPLDRNDVLPDAEHFLVHPSLDLLIGGYNPGYFRHLDKLNVIGAERPWRSAREVLFVLKGDVRGAGAIFQDPVAGTSFPPFFAEAVAEAGRPRGRARQRRRFGAAGRPEPAPAGARGAGAAPAAAALGLWLRHPLRRRRRLRRGRRRGRTRSRGRGWRSWSPRGSSRTRRRVRSWSPASSWTPGATCWAPAACARGRSSHRTCLCCGRATAASTSPSRAARRRCSAGCGCWKGRKRSLDVRRVL